MDTSHASSFSSPVTLLHLAKLCVYKRTLRSTFVGVVPGQPQDVSIRWWMGVDVLIALTRKGIVVMWIGLCLK